jgi:hypothetical protein
MKHVLWASLLFLGSISSFSQDSLSKEAHQYRNVIKLNPTPMLVFSNLRNFTIAYERLVNKNQSIVLQLGYLEFRPLFNDSIEGLFSFDRRSNMGANIAFDYRFYPLNRNKFQAPNGLYIGGYLSYYGFRFKDEVSIDSADPVKTGDLEMKFNYINLGFMVGYQFIFWKHFAIDMLIFGPSVTTTIFNTEMSSDFTQEEKNNIIETVKDKVAEKYPTFTPFVDINNSRNSTEVRLFFRYSLSLGYHF